MGAVGGGVALGTIAATQRVGTGWTAWAALAGTAAGFGLGTLLESPGAPKDAALLAASLGVVASTPFAIDGFRSSTGPLGPRLALAGATIAVSAGLLAAPSAMVAHATSDEA